MKSSKLAIGKSTPANIVVGNDDLLTEILKRLPVIPLLRFKSVCRQWYSLITHPLFSPLPNPNQSLPSGFLLPSLLSSSEFDFVPLDAKNPVKSPFRTLDFAPDAPGITILSSTNGLLCCGNITSPNASGFYVYNPCNQKFAYVPPPDVGARARNIIIAVHIAFDPLISPFYKLILVVLASRPPHQKRILIDIFSSETGKWKLAIKIFNMSFRTQFRRGIYFSGAIHWYSQSSSTYYFDVDQEQGHKMPMPPFAHAPKFRFCQYFGECSGHLHLIESYGPFKPQFDVYEMEKDHSRWFLKYRVNLSAMVNMYGDMILDRCDPMGRLHYGCFPLYLFETEINEDSYLVLHIPDLNNTVWRYHDSKTKWGFDELISLKDFKDSSKGYLKENSCIFGVEFFIVKNTGKGESLRIKNPEDIVTYTWKIHNYSKLDEKEIYQNKVYDIGGCQWKLRFHPKGDRTSRGKNITAFLEIVNSAAISPEKIFYIEFTLRVKNQFPKNKDFETQARGSISSTTEAWGKDLLSLNHVKDVSRGWLVNNTLTLELEVTKWSRVYDFN